MNTFSMIRLVKILMTAMCFAVFSINTYAAAAKVEFAFGGATVTSSDGSSKTLSKGMEINQGDTILTGAGRAQLKFSDGAYLSFQPNTEFKIEEYNFNGQQDGTEKGFFRLVKGGLRAISGLVGREHRPAYRLATPVATIGIRGSYFLADFQDILKTHVGHGSIYVFNEFGDIILFEGQGAEVAPGEAPKSTGDKSKQSNAGPNGAQPDQIEPQQLAENMNNNLFSVSEIYDDTGFADLQLPSRGQCDGYYCECYKCGGEVLVKIQ